MTFRITGKMVLLMLFLVGMIILFAAKKSHVYGYDVVEPQPSQQTKNLFHFLMKNCMVGEDVNTELCSKVRHIYKSYCPSGEMCLGFFNSN